MTGRTMGKIAGRRWAWSSPLYWPSSIPGYGNDSRQIGPFGDFADDLLYAHLDASFIFNHLETMNGSPNFSSATAPRQKAGL